MIEPRIEAVFARLLRESSEDEEILEKIEEKLEQKSVPVPEEPDHYPFWGGMKVDDEELRRFLIDNDFFRQRSSDPSPSRARNEALDTVHIDDGVLKTYGEIALRNWVREYIEENGDAEDRVILARWARYKLKDIMDGLPIMTGNPQRDGPDVSYIPYRNGVVEISKAKVELKPYKDLQEAVREDSVRDRDIDISSLPKLDLDQPIATQVQPSPFTKFIIYAFKRGMTPDATHPIEKNNPLWDGTDNDEWREGVAGYETSVGYLIHRHHPSMPVAIIFVDGESMASQKSEGGTGKSLSLKPLEHLRELTEVSGKRMRADERFVFSGVDETTEIVLLNDVRQDMDFEDLFNVITDDMEVEKKGINKKVIPKALKPKIGITSNYIITGNDTSTKRRQHIISFGTFLNKVTEMGLTDKSMSVEALVGAYLFDDDKFSAADWNAFDCYCILCVQKYLNTDLITPENKGYKQALLANTVGDDEVFEWMEAWVNKGGYEQGIAQSQIYKEFSAAFVGDILLVRWDEKLFLDRLFEYVLAREDVEWNPDQEAKGDTRRKRRWPHGPAGRQEPWVKIVSK